MASDEESGELTGDVAPVVPRAMTLDGSAHLPLNALVEPILRSRNQCVLAITAEPGGGVTTALRYLRAVLPHDLQVRLFDSHQRDEFIQAVRAGRTIVGLPPHHNYLTGQQTASFKLIEWTFDDCMEYVITKHRVQCATLLSKLRKDPGIGLFHGSPQILSLAMDAMAGDESLKSLEDACRRELGQIIPAEARQKLLATRELLIPGLSPEQMKWWRHEAVRMVLAADWIVDSLCDGQVPEVLKGMWPTMIPRIAQSAKQRPEAMEPLRNMLVNDPRNSMNSMAAAIMLDADPDWKPSFRPGIWLRFAPLHNASWPDAVLRDASLAGVNFSGANLYRADCKNADAGAKANFSGADLTGARLTKAQLQKAEMTRATLLRVDAIGTDFSGANLEAANLSEANLRDALFHDACLNNTDCRTARFEAASLWRTSVAGGDFRAADFTRAHLNHVDMTEAQWTGANFARARLHACDLQGIYMPGGKFACADLGGSLLTSSRIPGGDFHGADLSKTGLADVDWENADLRDVNFTDASFHLGSTRSGLVGSVIPSEGSRTGFYTDEYNEQNFRPPEEIRKANLRGVNLIGAKIEGTDFYLVDLRGAIYTKKQAVHLARCQAILEDQSPA